MARPRSSLAFALLLAGCTAKNPDYGGVARDAEPHAEVPARPDSAASTGGVTGTGGGGGMAGTAGSSPPVGGEGGTSPGTPDATADVEPPVDTAAPEDTSPEAPGQTLCGADRPVITGIVNSDGLAIGLDGTIYYSSTDDTTGYVGRLRPEEPLQSQWLRIERQPVTWGMALDTARKKLYYASDTAIFGFDLDFDPPLRFPVTAVFAGINDLLVAPDGSLLISVQSDRSIYRLATPTSMAVKISKGDLGSAAQNQGPAALAFGPDGDLFVGLQGKGAIVKLVLDGAGKEASRSNFGAFSGWANGLAFDSLGRLYVGLWDQTIDNEIAVLAPSGASAGKLVLKGRFASMAFGRGALSCRDLYVANPLGPLRRQEIDTDGLPPP